MRRLIACIALLFVAAPLHAADEPAQRREGLRQLIGRFDDDGDGRLNADERAAAVKFLKETRRDGGMPAVPQTVVPGESDLYKLAPGSLPLRDVETYTLHDAKRDKDILLRLTFPETGGPYPLVILCHGALGSKDGYAPLAEHWASHGYVVIRPTFGDSISLMTPEDKRNVRSIVDLVNSSQVNREWDQRPRDVSCVIDSLDELERHVAGLAGKINREHIAAAGHSYGAHTTMMLAGMRLSVLGKQTDSFRDDRIDAFIAISPQGPGSTINAASYQAMIGPMLMITGDNDGSPRRGQENKGGAWRREAFDQCKIDEAYLLWIKDAHHGFGGITGTQAFPTAGPVAPDQVYYVKSTALAFLDACVKTDAAAKRYLQSGQLNRVTNNAATLTAKTAD